MEKCPRWLETFIALVRPGTLLAMVALLVMGGFVFAIVEFFSPGSGDRAMRVFVGFFGAMDDNYYNTIQVMFTTYVIARSGQAVAKEFATASVEKVKGNTVGTS
jgi:C4-dicarboxylate transporter